MKLLYTLPLLLASLPSQAQKCPPLDAVFYNAHILTGKDLLTHPQYVSAIAIASGHIYATGTDAQMLGLCDTIAHKVDLHGAFVLPGFNDAHTHIAFAGQQRLSVDLDNIPSLAAMQAKIKTYAATLPADAAKPSEIWITGGGWDHTKWTSKQLPTRQDLDAVTGPHPAYLERTDGHIAIVNTAALTAAGITAETPAPQGSKIDIAPDGQPTGIIREAAALALIQAHIPKPDQARRKQALTVAINDALAHGVTSVQDFSDWDDFLALESLEADHQLHLRVSEWLTFNDPIETLKAHRDYHPATDPMLHTGMLKGFMDGSLGSRTAALAAPYSDDPKNSGLPRYDQKALNKLATERAGAGFQLGFHAIGDKANNMALSAFENSEANLNGQRAFQCGDMDPRQPKSPQLIAWCNTPDAVASRELRLRIEHAQVLLPADFDRFAKLHIIASMQPSHLLTDMAWATDRLGPDRAKYAYAWRSMLDHKITLAFGTDFPVESINPFRGLYSAVTRQNEAGTETFHPEQKLTLPEALYAYTQGSAFAENMERQKGILAPGFFADFVILDRDITQSTPQQLLQTRVLRTVVGGVTAYEAPATTAAEPTYRRLPDGD